MTYQIQTMEDNKLIEAFKEASSEDKKNLFMYIHSQITRENTIPNNDSHLINNMLSPIDYISAKTMTNAYLKFYELFGFDAKFVEKSVEFSKEDLSALTALDPNWKGIRVYFAKYPFDMFIAENELLYNSKNTVILRLIDEHGNDAKYPEDSSHRPTADNWGRLCPPKCKENAQIGCSGGYFTFDGYRELEGCE